MAKLDSRQAVPQGEEPRQMTWPGRRVRLSYKLGVGAAIIIALSGAFLAGFTVSSRRWAPYMLLKNLKADVADQYFATNEMVSFSAVDEMADTFDSAALITVRSPAAVARKRA